MKFTKKFASAIMVALLIVSAITLSACGGAELTAVYIADPSTSGSATLLSSPMQMIVTSEERIFVYSDGTYCLTVSCTMITGLKAITEGNDQVIDRGTTIVEYYGTCTSEVDSGMTVLTLSAPDRFTITNTNGLFTIGFPIGYLDSATLVVDEALTTWWTTIGAEGECTAANILAKLGYQETVVTVAETGVFDYVKVGYHYAIMGALFGLS